MTKLKTVEDINRMKNSGPIIAPKLSACFIAFLHKERKLTLAEFLMDLNEEEKNKIRQAYAEYEEEFIND